VSVLLDMELSAREAELHALSRRGRTVSLVDARELVSRIIDATVHLRDTWEYPRRALGTDGLEGKAFEQVCRKTLRALDLHLAVMALIREAVVEAYSAAGVAVEGLDAFDEAEAAVWVGRREVEAVQAFVAQPRKPVDWETVRKAEEAFGRGECVRLNPAPGARPAPAAG
jgi:hypothetical protein